MEKKIERPRFPEKAIITAGMPYGNKELHFGHIGGVFIPSDTFARFLRNRIGKENVIFVSGTDCYGSPIVESYNKFIQNNESDMSLLEYVKRFHNKQLDTLNDYKVKPDHYGASAFGDSSKNHRNVTRELFLEMYRHKNIVPYSVSQFFDPIANTYLNGRQVTGKCPFEHCGSGEAYADECANGHQYFPKDLISPKSNLSGSVPILKESRNWYFLLGDERENLEKWANGLKENNYTRDNFSRKIQEFLIDPCIHIKNDNKDLFNSISKEIPGFKIIEGKSNSFTISFDSLEERERCVIVLNRHSIKYRTGKTLVPFRISGNLDWGVPVPEKEDLANLTYWVWPESLVAPISFTDYLVKTEQIKGNDWKDWWCNPDTEIYQFIGEDNVYFYCLAEVGLFLSLNRSKKSNFLDGREIKIPNFVVNHHLLYGSRKASSSDKVKPPMANDLLNSYTSEQLRVHFLNLGLSKRSVDFKPSSWISKGNTSNDPVFNDGNLLSNSFNRVARTCFYSCQEHFSGILPYGEISGDVLANGKNLILRYEREMHKQNFHMVINIMNKYIRGINKNWAGKIYKIPTAQLLIDTFHMLRVSATLMNPIAPEGTEKIREYLNIDERIWSWDYIFEELTYFMENRESHKFLSLKPKEDFFCKHKSQIRSF